MATTKAAVMRHEGACPRSFMDCDCWTRPGAYGRCSLHAAAPDLLAALEAALPLIIHAWRKSADARDTQAEERYSETGKAMQAAISKATNA